ncbi:hypothetical protein ACA910_022042 [Epithemia clementina (nom. ined.)]
MGPFNLWLALLLPSFYHVVKGFQPRSFKTTTVVRHNDIIPTQQLQGNDRSVTSSASSTTGKYGTTTTRAPLSSVLSATATTAPEDSLQSSEEWTKKRLHNTPVFRGLSLLGVFALVGFSSRTALPLQATASVHLLSFSTWFGSVAYTTFILGITMFKNLPRQTFGKLQAKLFPKYFALGSIALMLQLITLPVLPVVFVGSSSKALGLAFAMTMLNQFYLEPKSTKIMLQRYELEGQAGGKDTNEYKSLKASFGKLHGMSSLTNLIALCAGMAHAIFLARALV